MSLPLPADFSLLRQITDVHCHPTDTEEPMRSQMVASCPINICAMSTRPDDQQLVYQLAVDYPQKVTPCFGYHPWFSHWIAFERQTKEVHYRSVLVDSTKSQNSQEDEAELRSLIATLPDPYFIDDIIKMLRDNLKAFPNALLGEVGLDRSMKVPLRSSPEGRSLSRFKVSIDHQLRLLECQIAIAVELERSVSLHSVNCQAITAEFLERMRDYHKRAWLEINIDLHSCGLSAETWKTIEKAHSNVYMSLSTVINEKSAGHRALIAACPPNRILAESDIHDPSQCAIRTWNMLTIIAGVKNWRVEENWVDNDTEPGVVHRLARNWETFLKRGERHTSHDASELELTTDEEEW